MVAICSSPLFSGRICDSKCTAHEINRMHTNETIKISGQGVERITGRRKKRTPGGNGRKNKEEMR